MHRIIGRCHRTYLLSRSLAVSRSAFLSTGHCLHLLSQGFSSLPSKCPTLTKLYLVSPQLVEVVFETGQNFHLSAEFLRVQSPAADSKRRKISGEKVIAGRRNVGIMSLEQVGNYGVRISFDDLHSTGIYSWDYLYHLGANKFTLMREYLNTLKKHNLGRSPGHQS